MPVCLGRLEADDHSPFFGNGVGKTVREISRICAAGDDDNQSQREWSPSVLVPAAHSKNYFPRVALQMRVLSDGLFRGVGTFPTSWDT